MHFYLHLHILKKALELRVTQQTWRYPKLKKKSHNIGKKSNRSKKVALL